MYFLFQAEHEIDKFIYNGWTLLLYAVSSVQLEIIEYLLTRGANPNKHKGMLYGLCYYFTYYFKFCVICDRWVYTSYGTV